jgi:hypothetical protein
VSRQLQKTDSAIRTLRSLMRVLLLELFESLSCLTSVRSEDGI